MLYSDFSPLLVEACDKNGISNICSGNVSQKLHLFLELLLEENQKYNLTAIKEPKSAIYKHFADCLLLCTHIPEGVRVIDVGCGAGFPSLPLAIARPDLKIISLDSTSKKLGFITKAANALGLNNISTLLGRAEELSARAPFRDSFDIVVARAVAAYPTLAEICLPFVAQDGKFIAMKGQSTNDEFANAASIVKKLGASDLQILPYELIADTGIEQRTLVFATKTQPTPKNFPRKYSQISKNPLS